jgi:hypothetical protein
LAFGKEVLSLHRHSLTVFRWGSKLINDGYINFYQFIVSFLGVYFSGQATSQLFVFAGSESHQHPNVVATLTTLPSKISHRATKPQITIFGYLPSSQQFRTLLRTVEKGRKTDASLSIWKTFSLPTLWCRKTGFSKAFLSP